MNEKSFRSLFKRQSDGTSTLIVGLTLEWAARIRGVLEQQFEIDAQAFDDSVAALTNQGYRLTSLVAYLKYPSTGTTQNKDRLCYEVRAKIGAKPIARSKGKRRQ